MAEPDLPYPGVAIAANTALILGSAFEAAAYCTFFGFARWRCLLYPFTALALLVFHGARAGAASSSDLVVLMAAIIATFSGAMAWILLRPDANCSLLRRVIGVNDGVFALVMGLCAYTTAVHDATSTLTPGAVQSAAYLAAYLLMIVNGFGFLLLCKEQDDRLLALLATIDSLTGLISRRAFFERADSARLLAARLHSPIAVMMIDIDHFKGLNDCFGHATGDKALRVFAATAQQTLRRHDIMGRLGGEEFALLLPGTDLEGATQAAERLRQTVAVALLAALPASDKQYGMTVSIGVVVIDPNEHVNSALARADRALYAAKSGGRDRIVIGEPRLRGVG